MKEVNIIEQYLLMLRQIEIIKNIAFEIQSGKIKFSRLNGRFLFETDSIFSAVAYLEGICAQRRGID